jgi:hypothetical protein
MQERLALFDAPGRLVHELERGNLPAEKKWNLPALFARSSMKRKRFWIAAILFVLLVLAGLDLWAPVKTDIRQFDPGVVAKLDTDMWRSYYDRKPLPLYFQLADLLRRQFHFPWLRSYVVAYHAAKSAFVFKDGHNRVEYRRALPDLVRYFKAIEDISTTSFDVRRASELELEWWIVHRQRIQHQRGDLDLALAEAAGALYRVPAASLMEYGRERTAAMDIRDTRAVSGGVRASDWNEIERHLQVSWQSLWNSVQPVIATPR